MRDRDRELIAAIRAQHRETFGTGRLRTRYKRCHEIAATALISGTAPADAVLVQGIDRTVYGVSREHSWLELPDGRLWDPVTCELDTLRPQVIVARYTCEQARSKLLETGFWGWWSGPSALREVQLREASEEQR